MKGQVEDFTYFPEEIFDMATESDCDQYIAENCINAEEFHQYLNEKIVEKNISVPILMQRSCINKNYGYNILNGARKKPSRDRVLALCIAARMTLGEVQQGLILAKQGILYWRDERDVRIAFAINSGISDVMRLNIILLESGSVPLEV